MQVKRGQPSIGMTDASSPSMNWSVYVPQCLFWPKSTLSGPSGCTPMLVGIVCRLSSTRPMATGLMPSSPIPAGAWPRLRPITQPTNWRFLLLSGMCWRSSMNTSMGWLLAFITKTIPLHTFNYSKAGCCQPMLGSQPCQLQLHIIW